MCSGDEIGSAGKLPHNFHLQLNSKLRTAFQRMKGTKLLAHSSKQFSTTLYTAKFKVIEHIFTRLFFFTVRLFKVKRRTSECDLLPSQLFVCYY